MVNILYGTIISVVSREQYRGKEQGNLVW